MVKTLSATKNTFEIITKESRYDSAIVKDGLNIEVILTHTIK